MAILVLTMVCFRKISECCYLMAHPRIAEVEFCRHQFGDGTRHLNRRLRIQEESARSAREYVVECAGHLFSYRPDDFGGGIRKRGMNGSEQGRVSSGDGADRFRVDP